ncbi:MAG: SDR family NAD(P)-dependent oxidoreductase [Leptospiraceae bacterium]|nr:SDR family NAD(P)-dependent oxidoreductase [Leptospiraceae bacterium]MCP5511993.1 SDR family NAD(P)-dependent oxidoreductase [Leptospiraceae bacterium]
MIEIIKHVDVATDIKTTSFFLSDFSRLKEWNPNVEKSRKITPGKINIGSRFFVLREYFSNKIAIIYRITDYTPGKFTKIYGESENLEITHSFEFERNEENGTRVKFTTTYRLKGVLSPWEGFLGGFLNGITQNAIEGMKRALSEKTNPSINFINRFLYPLIIPVIHDFTKFGYRNSRQRYRAVTGSLHGKTALVTGATSGLGYETSIMLARNEARVVIVGRDPEKLETAVENIKDITGNPEVYGEIADLSLLSENKRLADLIKFKYQYLSILINNVGNLFNDHLMTVEGNEKSISLLLLGPYVLTESLYPMLIHNKDARVINVSSGGMYTQKLYTNDLNSLVSYNGAIAYARAKRGLVILSNHWAEKWRKSGVKSFSMHPGWADTASVRNSLPVFYRFMKSFLRTSEEGADSIFWLSSSDELENKTGGFWFDRELQPEHIFWNTENSDEEIYEFLNYLESTTKNYIKKSLF